MIVNIVKSVTAAVSITHALIGMICNYLRYDEIQLFNLIMLATPWRHLQEPQFENKCHQVWVSRGVCVAVTELAVNLLHKLISSVSWKQKERLCLQKQISTLDLDLVLRTGFLSELIKILHTSPQLCDCLHCHIITCAALFSVSIFFCNPLPLFTSRR